MTRDEFESILEELFEEGYNQALCDIQEDILDESAYNLEDEYDCYIEQVIHERLKEHRKLLIKSLAGEAKEHGYSKAAISDAVRKAVRLGSDSKYINKKKAAQKIVDDVKGIGGLHTAFYTMGLPPGKAKDIAKKYGHKVSDHIGSHAFSTNMEPLMKGTVNRFYTKIDELHDKGEHDKANALEKGFDDDKKTLIKKVYKHMIAPKYDKESIGKKILKGDISGAARKSLASKIVSLRKQGKKYLKDNGGFTPEKRMTPEEKHKIQQQWKEKYSNMKPDNSEETKQLRKEAEKFSQGKNNKPKGYNIMGYSVVKSAPITKYLPKKLRNILIDKAMEERDNKGDY